LYVRDEGQGIAPDDLKKVFDKFVQVGNARKKKQGTGLGLNISQGIVAAHDGVLWVTSPGEGKGTTFSFVIPD
jgi:two-component system sensor histidine kinase VicK